MSLQTYALPPLLGLLALAASGCTSTQIKDVIPENGPTMEQIYAAHMNRIRAAGAEGARLELKGRPAADPRSAPQAPRDNGAGAPGLMTVSLQGPGAELDADAGEPGVMKVPAPARRGGTGRPQTRSEARPRAAGTADTIDGAPVAGPVPGVRATEVNLAGYTRTAATEIDAIFPRLPNPDLVMYVFPHLSEQGAPVPGYATSFPMYERIEYALPGEVPGERP